jgi:hypothetical protein
MDAIIKEFNETGNCVIDIDYAIKKWNHLYWIAQWNDTYRLIIHVRKDSPITKMKVSISEKQAKELIAKLKLTGVNGGFKSSTTWKQ